MKKIVVWYNPNKKVYYYRITKGLYHEHYDYKVGERNSYDHVIVCVIPFYKIQLPKPPRTPLYNKLSSFLNLFERR